jgi:pyruvate dehydrogenase E2 component (dihydrolipoamide acetyltransferase)
MSSTEAPPAEAPGRGTPQVEPLPLMRKAMVRAMNASAAVPCFYLRMTADVTALLEQRRRVATHGDVRRPSVNDLIVHAAARALRAHPAVNASYGEDAVELHPRVNVGVAIAVPGGLVVPAVYDADRKSPAEIGVDVRALADRAARRKLGRDVLADATFTVSNLGMYGIESFDPVLNPPQAAILGVGKVAGDGARSRLELTLGCDHRVLTGAEGAVFLRALVERLESTSA